MTQLKQLAVWLRQAFGCGGNPTNDALSHVAWQDTAKRDLESELDALRAQYGVALKARQLAEQRLAVTLRKLESIPLPVVYAYTPMANLVQNLTVTLTSEVLQ